MRTVFAICFTLASAALSAQDIPTLYHRVSTVPEAPQPGQNFLVRIQGTWPNACAFELLPLSVNGQDIQVTVRQTDAICADVLREYTLTVDPSTVAGSGFPAAGSYRVRFNLRLPDGGLRLLGFRSVPVQPNNARAIELETGFWNTDAAGPFQTSGMGVGFNMERQGNALFFITNMYEDGGRATWYLSAGNLVGNHFRSDLLQTFGGQPLFGSYRGPQGYRWAGQIEVEFEGPAEATLWYSKPAGEGILDGLSLQPISVRRFNFALGNTAQALTGRWVFTPSGSGSDLAPQFLNLVVDGAQSSSSSVLLRDSGSNATLRCALDTQRVDGPPKSCEYSRNGVVVARFSNNSLTQLDGNEANSARGTSLVRLGN